MTLIQKEPKYIVTGYEWLPGENTIAYFPFKDDNLDHSWNSTILSTSWTKQTIWYLFNTNTSFSYSGDVKFFCCWTKLNSATWTTWAAGTFYDPTSMWWYLYQWISWTHPEIWTFYTSWYAKASVQITDVNNWHLLWVWYDWTNTIYCIDNTYWILRAWAWYNFWNSFALYWQNGNTIANIVYSNFIAESKCWNAEEVAKYYDLTKWNYWYNLSDLIIEKPWQLELF